MSNPTDPKRLGCSTWCRGLSHLSGLPLDIHVFRSFLSLKYKFISGYYITSDPNYQVISDSYSAHKRWEEYFFFIRGLIGEVPYKFGALCKIWCFNLCVIVDNVLWVMSNILRVFAAPSSLKKVPLSPVVKDRLSDFFYVVDRSKVNLLSTENLMASGIISLRYILARARAGASIGAKKADGASASTQPVLQ